MIPGKYIRTKTHKDNARQRNINLDSASRLKKFAFQKGNPAWNKGVPRTPEEKTAMSNGRKGIKAWNKGKSMAEASRQKLSASLKLLYTNPENRKKLSEAHIGQVSPRKGTTLTDETKMKIKKAKLGKKMPLITGSRHPNWKGGISSQTELIKHTIEYKQWRTSVFVRDDFTCQECGTRGGKLEAHHKKTFNQLIDEVKFHIPTLCLLDAALLYTPLWDVNNGVTVCKECHTKVYHKKRYRGVM